MSIWFREYNLDDLQKLNHKTAAGTLNIRYTTIGDDFLEAEMAVDDNTRQPYGILHGGASALLAETLGSIGSSMVINREHFITVGIQLNVNHLRQAKEGFVTGKATPVHLGSKVHVWNVEIRDEHERLICSGKLTCMILPK